MTKYKLATNERELIPQYDKSKSFWGKATLIPATDGSILLRSYETIVAEDAWVDGKWVPKVYDTYSATTLRHIKEFLRQRGYKVESKQQIIDDYGVK